MIKFVNMLCPMTRFETSTTVQPIGTEVAIAYYLFSLSTQKKEVNISFNISRNKKSMNKPHLVQNVHKTKGNKFSN